MRVCTIPDGLRLPTDAADLCLLRRAIFLNEYMPIGKLYFRSHHWAASVAHMLAA